MVLFRSISWIVVAASIVGCRSPESAELRDDGLGDDAVLQVVTPMQRELGPVECKSSTTNNYFVFNNDSGYLEIQYAEDRSREILVVRLEKGAGRSFQIKSYGPLEVGPGPASGYISKDAFSMTVGALNVSSTGNLTLTIKTEKMANEETAAFCEQGLPTPLFPSEPSPAVPLPRNAQTPQPLSPNSHETPSLNPIAGQFSQGSGGSVKGLAQDLGAIGDKEPGRSISYSCGDSYGRIYVLTYDTLYIERADGSESLIGISLERATEGFFNVRSVETIDEPVIGTLEIVPDSDGALLSIFQTVATCKQASGHG